jgi:hypothetical protein
VAKEKLTTSPRETEKILSVKKSQSPQPPDPVPGVLDLSTKKIWSVVDLANDKDKK